jgi:predicted PP-loop superfamily ATPase
MRKKSLQQIEDLLARHREPAEAPPIADVPQPVLAQDVAMQSAEAFDALREELSRLRIDRQTHQAHIAEMHRVLVATDGSAVKVPLLMANDLLRQVGVNVVTDVGQRNLFSCLDDDDDDGASYVVVQPAYIEESTNRVVRQGRIRIADRVAR